MPPNAWPSPSNAPCVKEGSALKGRGAAIAGLSGLQLL
jgi:hypothetical protein